MKPNVGNFDRIARVLVSLVLVALYFTNVLTGTLGIIAIVVAAVFTLTAAIGFCPLYAIFGLNTCPAKK